MLTVTAISVLLSSLATSRTRYRISINIGEQLNLAKLANGHQIVKFNFRQYFKYIHLLEAMSYKTTSLLIRHSG